MKKILIFTDSDLDGAGCAAALKWLLPKTYDITIMPTTISKFRNELLDWLKTDKLSNYDLVFICDLDTTELSELVDFNNVYIIDHHESHNPLIYKNCKTHIINATSATLLIYKLFLENKNISKEKIALIKLIDDYDSFNLKYKQSKELNIIYWSLTGNRPIKFYEIFNEGFKGFDKFQINTINNYQQKLNKLISSIQLFKGIVNFENKQYNCLSTIVDSCINDVGEYIYKTYNTDIVFIVNLKSNVVSLRKNPNCNIDLSKLAKQIGNGGGHTTAAGCPLNDQFMELMKNFIPYE